MLVDFNSLPDEARVWIYQSNRTFSETELVEVRQEIETFLQDWTAHGSDLNAGYEMPYNRFIVFGLDQVIQGATGCSIDASVRFIQGLEKKYTIDLLDKMNVSYKQGEFVAYKTLIDFRAMAKNKSVSKNTIVFNNLVTNKEEYLSHWEVPAEESWHGRFM
jgi:hypothetical protein